MGDASTEMLREQHLLPVSSYFNQIHFSIHIHLQIAMVGRAKSQGAKNKASHEEKDKLMAEAVEIYSAEPAPSAPTPQQYQSS